MLAASGLETEASKESLCARVTLYRRKGMVEAERRPSGQRESTLPFSMDCLPARSWPPRGSHENQAQRASLICLRLML